MSHFFVKQTYYLLHFLFTAVSELFQHLDVTARILQPKKIAQTLLCDWLTCWETGSCKKSETTVAPAC